jgi:hypothetical protein
MESVLMHYRKLSLDHVKGIDGKGIDAWLYENVGTGFFEKSKWNVESISLFEKSDCQYVVLCENDGVKCVFKDTDKAMLFKLTWC